MGLGPIFLPGRQSGRNSCLGFRVEGFGLRVWESRLVIRRRESRGVVGRLRLWVPGSFGVGFLDAE